VFEDVFERHPAEEQVHGVETLERLLVRAAVDGQLKLRERAGFGVRELTGAADESGKQDGRTGPEQKPVFTKRLLRNGLNGKETVR
jgi:hypothetical protein